MTTTQNQEIFYMHVISGDVFTLDDWHADYISMDVEDWHGKEAGECDPEDWIKDGSLIEVEMDSDGEWVESA